MTRKIVITSGKGGVGKTTICCGLGYSLSRLGLRVLLIDMDFGLNNLDILMGIENKIVYDIIDVLEGKCMPKDALVQDFFEPNLYTFPSTHGFCKVKFGAKELCEIIEELETDFDYILIDCPAGIDGGFRRAVGCADEYIVVTTAHLSAIRDADKVINLIRNSNMCNSGNEIKLIVNRLRGDMVVNNEIISPNTISKYLNIELIGVVPEDDYNISYYDNKNNPIQQSLDMIANNVVSGNKDIIDYTKKYRGVIGSIRKKLRKIV